MPLFWKPYKSDVTPFIEELKAKKPTLEDEQRAGRAMLWDRRSIAAPGRVLGIARAAAALRLPDAQR